MAVNVVCAGGLGNQLFQYAAARSLCDSIGADLIVDTRFYPRDGDGNKAFGLDGFPIRARIRRYPSAGLLSAHSLIRRAERLVLSRATAKSYFESNPGYDEQVSRLRDGATMTGYFQSYRYSWSNLEQIRRDLDARPELNGDYAKVVTDAASFTSVHVRRGDYVGDTNFELSDASAYYARAMDLVRTRQPAARFLIFSDDIDWCRRSSMFSVDCEFFAPACRMGPLEDLMVMSRCAHHIIANSSYSWWAAALGVSETHKTVVAPRRWIYGFSSDDMQIIPPGWIQI